MNFSYPELPSPTWLQAEGALIERLVVHCWAAWNAYDSQMHRHLVLAQQQLLPMEMEVRSLDTDNEAFGPFLKEYGFRGVPTIMLFSCGKHLKTQIGLLTPDGIVKRVTGMIRI